MERIKTKNICNACVCVFGEQRSGLEQQRTKKKTEQNNRNNEERIVMNGRRS